MIKEENARLVSRTFWELNDARREGGSIERKSLCYFREMKVFEM
jgi:hypothetical protein